MTMGLCKGAKPQHGRIGQRRGAEIQLNKRPTGSAIRRNSSDSRLAKSAARLLRSACYTRQSLDLSDQKVPLGVCDGTHQNIIAEGVTNAGQYDETA